jgi:hypothetical protein
MSANMDALSDWGTEPIYHGVLGKSCVLPADAVPDLPLGKISVLVSIGAEQFKARMIEDSDTTFRSAHRVRTEGSDASRRSGRRPPSADTARGALQGRGVCKDCARCYSRAKCQDCG